MSSAAIIQDLPRTASAAPNPLAFHGPDSPKSEKNASLAHANNGDSAEKGDDASTLVGVDEKSRGVVEMEQLMERMGRKYYVLLYGGFALLAYSLSLNQYTSATFLSTAVSVSFGQHALQSTIGTITGVFQAMSQPPIAKLADATGRVKTYAGCVLFYVIGYIVVASSSGIVTYAVGNSIYILGITGLFLLQNIIISDISSLRNRYWWSCFPNIPGAINVWVSGDVAQSLLENGTAYWKWRWGFGMFVILTPVLAAPIIITLWHGTRLSRERRAERQAAKRRQISKKQAVKTSFINFFWQLDFIGLFLFVAGFGMFFVTITLANSRTARWSDAHSIALLTVGGLTIIAFVVKTVIGCTLIALFHPMGGRIVNGYFYTFLVVAGNYDIKTATRLTSVPTFSATIIAIFASLLVSRYRRLKPVILFGFTIQTLAFGLMVRFRTSENALGEIIAVQVLKGAGIGCISFPTQAVIQSAASHENLGAITAAYLVVFYVSSAIGASIGGAIWTNIVPGRISAYMNDEDLAAKAYGDPFGFAQRYAVGTLQRAAVARAQDEAQRVIVIVGTCVCFLGLLTAVFLIDNVRMPDTQSMEEGKDNGAETTGGRWLPFGKKREVV